jgi:3-methyl-2-oxobutanoate hydroxymethyltransferase
MNILDFQLKKQKSEKISMVTCYDFTFAKILNESQVDCLLVGDSAAMVMHGQNSTLNIDIHQMAIHVSAVAKGAPQKFLVGDMPFLSYRLDLAKNLMAMGELMKAGANAVKLEGAKGNLDLIRHAVDSGIPVMGHVGLTPQSVNQLGGFKVQGKEQKEHDQIFADALALEKAGCFSLVLECVPASLAQKISKALQIPTIGIGAGMETDGQVLVLQDMLGMNNGFKPKFLKTYAQGFEIFKAAFNQYHEEVQSKKFPTEKESYL